MAKYTCYFKHKIYCNIYQNLAKQFTLRSAETYSESFQTSKQVINSLEVTVFTKSSVLDVSKRSEYANAQETIKQSNHIRQRQTI